MYVKYVFVHQDKKFKITLMGQIHKIIRKQKTDMNTENYMH